MPAANVTFDMARSIALTLPGVEEGSMYGSPALKLHGRLLACLAMNKSAEPDSLVVRTGFDERAALLAEEPATYYVTNHYLNHPVVLVRMSKIGVDQLQDLLRSAWRFVTDHEKKKAVKRSGAAKARIGKQVQKRRHSEASLHRARQASYSWGNL